MKLAFVDARPQVAWVKAPRSVEGTCDGVAFAIKARWWGGQVTVVGESPFPVPEPMLLYVSARGMDHGFWRDLRVGDDGFDYRFFVFSDVPALLPLVVGRATRQAMRDDGPHHDDIVLYVRGGVVQTTSSNAFERDPTVIDRHVAIHRALARDHQAVLESWRDRMSDAQGRAELLWPPMATLLRPTGTLEVRLTWAPPVVSRDGSDWDAAARSLRTEVIGRDDRKREAWSVSEVGAMAACTHVLDERRFVVRGRVPLPMAQLEELIARGRLAAIACASSELTVTLHGVASPTQIEVAVRIVQLVVDANAQSESPYR